MVRLTRILGEAGLDPDRLVRAPAGRHCAPSPAMFEAFLTARAALRSAHARTMTL